MSFDPAISEWRGVTQIYDRVKNGLYRANATSIVFFFYLLALYFGVKLAAPEMLHGWSWSDGLSALFGFPIFVWIIAFCLGYAGTAFVGAGVGVPIENVTPDTNMSTRMGDWIPFQSIAAEDTTANDMYTGRLTAGSEGLDGIIKFSWKDILSIGQLNPQNVSIKRISRFFGIPLGKRSFMLHFDTPADLSSFISVTRQYLDKKS